MALLLRLFLVFICIVPISADAAFFHGLGTGSAPPPVTPVIASVTFSPASGFFNAGKVITIQFAFSQPVTIAGGAFPSSTATVALNSGSTTAKCPTSLAAVSTWTCTYTVGSSDNSTALALGATALTLNSSTVVGTTGGANANLTAANGVVAPGGIDVDTTAPIVTSVVGSGTGITGGNGTITTSGVPISIQITLSQPVTTTASPPTLSLNNGGTASCTSCLSGGPNAPGSYSQGMTFTYTTVTSQNTTKLALTAVNLLSGNLIADQAGNNANTAAAIPGLGGTIAINVGGPLVCTGTNYYIAANGSDSNNGTGPSTPWLTLGKINSAHFTAGNCINLRGGDTFTPANSGVCPIFSASNFTGSSSNPVFMQSTAFGGGTGQATINASGCATGGVASAGITVNGVNGLTLQNMVLFATGGGTGGSGVQAGVMIYNTSGANSDSITVQNMDISGFAFGAAPSTGAAEVFLVNDGAATTNFKVLNNSLHGRGCSLTPGANCAALDDGGVSAGESAQGGIISGNLIYNMGGSAATRTGGLIGVFNGASSITVTHNHIWNAGNNVTSCGGMGAIEAAGGAPNMVFAHNEFDHIQQFAGCDSDGLDLDADVSNNIVEYNYSHNNGGAGIYGFIGSRLYSDNCPGGCTWGGNIYRYNISENDGNWNGAPGGGGGMTFNFINGSGPLSGSPTLSVYNNTVYQAGLANPGVGSSVLAAVDFFANGNFSGLFENNLIIATNGASGLYCQTGSLSGIVLGTNDYYFPSGGFNVGQNCSFGQQSTLAGWKSASGETTALSTNPMLVSNPPFSTCASWNNGVTNSSIPTGPTPCPAGYKLNVGSPLLGTGTAIANSGGSDYYNDTVPNGIGTGYNIGADGGTGPSAVVLTNVCATGSGLVGSCPAGTVGNLAALQSYNVFLTFNLPVTVTNSSGLTLTMNSADTAAYTSGSGTTTLEFTVSAASAASSSLLRIASMNLASGTTVLNNGNAASVPPQTFVNGLVGHFASAFTGFPLVENPISQGSTWNNAGLFAGGGASGWANVQTFSNQITGVYPLANPNGGDASANLSSGTYGASQQASAIVSIVAGTPTSATCCADVDLRLNQSLIVGSVVGYEAACSVSAGFPYAIIRRHDGGPTVFTNLVSTSAVCQNGDQLSFTNVAGVLTLYQNGIIIAGPTAADTTYTSGTPGVGFYDTLGSFPNNGGTSDGIGYSTFSASQ